jgi:8-oxo-dGTP pyrophosphatase MutT (NUDIX family)
MRIDRPPPVEELSEGHVAPAREAATVIVMRDGAEGPEVLLVRRNPDSKFMGGAWVFPGGAVRAGDPDPAATALRELEEEAAIRLPGADALVPFSRWVTPEEVKVRFDTWFFVAVAPPETEGRPDGEECVDLRWLRPEDALAAYQAGDLLLVFPTIKHLEQLLAARSASKVLDDARGRSVEPILPRVVLRDGAPHVLLPGEPGYDD